MKAKVYFTREITPEKVVELYRARGTQLTDYGTVDRNDFGVYPTLSLLYMPSDAHELSLDLSTSIARPSYLMLNPFITYTSPTTCTQFNPDLKASRDLDLMFCYVLLDDYMLTVDYCTAPTYGRSSLCRTAT